MISSSFSGPLCFVVITAVSIPALAKPARQQAFEQRNLVSDEPGKAAHTDADLVNAWGLAARHGLIWVADNGTGVSTVYEPNGRPFPPKSPLRIKVPAAPGSDEGGKPTGLVFNSGPDFVVTENSHSGASLLLFAGEDGTISGWNPHVDATSAVLAARSPTSGAVYKGLALARHGSDRFLFATEFHGNGVDVFDSKFNFVRSFTDTTVPAGFAPFGIRKIAGELYVTFAKQKGPDNEDDDAGPGNGFVDVFDTAGNMLRRFASEGALNSPWGLAVASQAFGKFSGAVLIGNFGDGRINAYRPRTGEFFGPLSDAGGSPITIEGLWGLSFGKGKGEGKRSLFFTAGPDDESHGLFGLLSPVKGHKQR
jgi:uncharacterized protein (TIGR03118 family)